MKYKLHLIALLVKYQIVKWSFKRPLTFKSGIKAPIYFNFRETGTYLDLFAHICNGFVERFENKGFEGVVGVATGAIQYAANVGPRLNIPFGYVRPEPKGHGLEKQIDGLDVSGKKILLIEDLVTTAGSVLKAAKVLIDAGAKEVEITSVFTYRMPVSESELKKAGYELQSLIDINDVLPALDEHLSGDEFISLTEWIKNPSSWFEKYKTTFDFGYLTAVRKSTAFAGNNLCVGVDPVIESLPEYYCEKGIFGFGLYFSKLIAKMSEEKVAIAAFKLNEGFYTTHDKPGNSDWQGSRCLLHVSCEIRKYYPNANIIFDNKRGDIGKSSDNYAAITNKWWFNSCTVQPYMGTDSVLPFAKFCNSKDGLGAYVLCRTSNSGASDFQGLKLADGRYVYEAVADKIIDWANGCPGVGAVVGATSLDELRVLAKKFAGKYIPLLIPGVGSQGGSLHDVLRILIEEGVELDLVYINSSSGLLSPWYKKAGDLIQNEEACIARSIAEMKNMGMQIINYTN